MKKFLYSIAAISLAFFASCAEDTFESYNPLPSSGDMIQFTLGDMSTRATLVEDTENLFKVYGTDGQDAKMQVLTYKPGTGSLDDDKVFEDALYRDGTQVKTEATHYWPAGDVAYDFFVLPESQYLDQSLISERHFKNAQFTFTYNAPQHSSANNDGEVLQDLVLAHKTGVKGQPVNLTFEHPLASVKFVYQSAMIAHHVSEIRIENAYAEGLCRFDTEWQGRTSESPQMMNWSFQDGVRNYVQAYANNEVYKEGQQIDKEGAIFTLIPGDGEDEPRTLTFVVTIDGKEYSKTCPSSSLKAGKTLIVNISDSKEITTNEHVGATKKYSKNSDGTYDLTMEAWVEGSPTSMAADIAVLVDVSGSMNNSMGSQTRMAVTRTAINTFIDNIEANGGDHRFAVATFSNDGGDKTIQNWIKITSSNKATIKNTIKNNTTPNGGTYIDDGLARIKTLFNNRDANRSTAKKVLVVITDGEPGAYANSYNGQVASDAINKAKELKDAGITVWSVFVGTRVEDLTNQYSREHVGEYMNALSSNYPSATSIVSGSHKETNRTLPNNVVTLGAPAEDLKYYVNASNPEDLNKVFESVVNDLPNMDSSAEISDIFSSSFALPTSGNYNVEFYTDEWVSGTTKAGNITWKGTPQKLTTGVTATTVGNTLKVTGFDYKKHYCGSHTNVDTEKPLKLIIKVKGLVLDANNAKDAGNYLTNVAGSGIYDANGKLVTSFVNEERPSDPNIIIK